MKYALCILTFVVSNECKDFQVLTNTACHRNVALCPDHSVYHGSKVE